MHGILEGDAVHSVGDDDGGEHISCTGTLAPQALGGNGEGRFPLLSAGVRHLIALFHTGYDNALGAQLGKLLRQFERLGKRP